MCWSRGTNGRALVVALVSLGGGIISSISELWFSLTDMHRFGELKSSFRHQTMQSWSDNRLTIISKLYSMESCSPKRQVTNYRR